MANGINPFGNLPQVLGGLVQQRFSPQFAETQARLQEAQSNQIRQNMATDFLASADFSRDPGGSLRTLGSILGDTSLIQAGVQADIDRRLFESEQRQLSQLAQEIGEIPVSPGREPIREAAAAAIPTGQQAVATKLLGQLEEPEVDIAKQLDIELKHERLAQLRKKGKGGVGGLSDDQLLQELGRVQSFELASSPSGFPTIDLQTGELVQRKLAVSEFERQAAAKARENLITELARRRGVNLQEAQGAADEIVLQRTRRDAAKFLIKTGIEQGDLDADKIDPNNAQQVEQFIQANTEFVDRYIQSQQPR